MDRRRFLASLGVCAGAPLFDACSPPSSPLPTPPGAFVGDDPAFGHRLRSGDFPPPADTRRLRVLIVGGGIGGLAAGWKLAKAGFRDFQLLEMAPEAGGNSRAIVTPAGPAPLAAHYLPLPGVQAVAVRELLAELGVLEGDPRAARPRYDERYLCATPQERLYRNGLWQEGLWPQIGIGAGERAQYARFQEIVATLRQRHAFAIPLALSQRSRDLLALDRVSMRDWLRAQGLDSPALHWYIDYACRDDYGTGIGEVSAWAGLHYFASRNGQAANAEDDTVLTAPDGNAFLTRGLAARCAGQIAGGALVHRVADDGRRYRVDAWFADSGRTLRYEAEQLIWAAPLFLVPRVFVGHEKLRAAALRFSHAPWLVASLTVSSLPAPGAGAAPAWDNVLYDGPGLGYVVSTHQQMRLAEGPAVLSYYRALADMAPAAGREALLARPREAWAEDVLADLGRAHADLRERVLRVDIARLGHAMVRPTVGFIWGGARAPFVADHPRLRFAHADVSGISIFEEAQYRGVLAAERTLRRLGVRFTSSLV